MGLQGDKATHDFLSLYTAAKDAALPLPPAPPPPSHQGFFLKTHDFLQPLERPPPPQAPAQKPLHQHALPGGIGTFSISSGPGGAPAVVKQEQPQPFALWGQPDPRATTSRSKMLEALMCSQDWVRNKYKVDEKNKQPATFWSCLQDIQEGLQELTI